MLLVILALAVTGAVSDGSRVAGPHLHQLHRRRGTCPAAAPSTRARSAPMRRARLLVPAQPRLFLDSPDWRQSAAGREWERERDDGDERRGSWLASGSWWFVGDDAVCADLCM
ncbi:hypothetical protein DAI22_01g421900 [Oryza sativa Japonica Group]|nr:hypothetical protein DAI22_01g421900 [Oryza sativa Japonica Group]